MFKENITGKIFVSKIIRYLLNTYEIGEIRQHLNCQYYLEYYEHYPLDSDHIAKQNYMF